MAVRVIFAKAGETVDLAARIPKDAATGDHFLLAAIDRNGEASSCAVVVMVPPEKHSLKKSNPVAMSHPMIGALGSLVVDLMARVDALEAHFKPRDASAPVRLVTDEEPLS